MEALFTHSPSHNALFEKIRTLCLSLPGTSERISHGAPSFFINEKLSFVQYRVNHHGDGRIALWCSAPSGAQSLFIETRPEIYFRPPYVGHLSGMIEDAYLNRAPKKYREMIKKS